VGVAASRLEIVDVIRAALHVEALPEAPALLERLDEAARAGDPQAAAAARGVRVLVEADQYADLRREYTAATAAALGTRRDAVFSGRSLTGARDLLGRDGNVLAAISTSAVRARSRRRTGQI